MRGFADVFFNPKREIARIAEAAFAGDVADALVGLLQQQGGFLQARLRDAVHDGHAGVEVKSPAQGAAIVFEFFRDFLGG